MCSLHSSHSLLVSSLDDTFLVFARASFFSSCNPYPPPPPLFFHGRRRSYALILGHSVLKRLKQDLITCFDARAARDVKLRGTASVHLHSIGGRTVPTLRANDHSVVKDLAPEVLILEIGTNDFSCSAPEVVGSAIEDLVRVLLNFPFRVIGVCHVNPHGISYPHASLFLQHARVLNNYARVVLEDIPNVSLLLDSHGF